MCSPALNYKTVFFKLDVEIPRSTPLNKQVRYGKQVLCIKKAKYHNLKMTTAVNRWIILITHLKMHDYIRMLTYEAPDTISQKMYFS